MSKIRILLKEPEEIQPPKGKTRVWGDVKHAILDASVEVDIDKMVEAWLKELGISHSLEEVQVIDTFKGKQRLFSQFLKEQIK